MSESSNFFINTFTYIENESQNQENQNQENQNQEDQNQIENIINNNEEDFIPIGLTRLNGFIYINPILQLLVGIKEFKNFFIQNKDIYKENFTKYKKTKLSFVTSRLYFNIYEEEEIKNSKLYNSSKFLTILKLLYKYIGNNANFKIKDIFLLILAQLDDENKINNRNEINIRYDNSSLEESINSGIEAVKNDNNSIISSTLNFILLRTIKCPKCNKNFFEIKSFTTYELNICSALQNIMSPKRKHNMITLKDCLDKEKINEGKPFKFYCKICEEYKIAKEIYHQFYEIKDKIIFLLDRDSILDENKLSVKIPFKLDEIIDMSEYLFINNNSINNPKYELTCVISGETKEKRYACFSKSFMNNKWYLYIDEYTEEKNIKEILDDHNNKCKFIPYILMYSKIK